MARGLYVQTKEIRVLRQLLAFAEDHRVSAETIARAGRAYVLPSALKAFDALTTAEELELKADLRAFFHAMARDEKAADTPEYRFAVTLIAASGPNGVVLFIDGAPRDVLLYQATTF